MTPQQTIERLSGYIARLADARYKTQRTACVDAMNLLDAMLHESVKERDVLAYQRHLRWCAVLIASYSELIENGAEASFLFECEVSYGA